MRSTLLLCLSLFACVVHAMPEGLPCPPCRTADNYSSEAPIWTKVGALCVDGVLFWSIDGVRFSIESLGSAELEVHKFDNATI